MGSEMCIRDSVMASGRILRTGGRELALELEQTGYDWVDKELAAQGVA